MQNDHYLYKQYSSRYFSLIIGLEMNTCANFQSMHIFFNIKSVNPYGFDVNLEPTVDYIHAKKSVYKKFYTNYLT